MTEMCECIGCEIVRIKDMIRDAVWNAGAHGVVIGISGGIDSAVAFALAVKSVGAQNVIAVNMPIKSNNPQDAADSEKLCRQYGVNMITVPLGNILNEFIKTENITDTPMLSGNTASRLRMTVLYNIAGAKKYLVCGTSNKTEYMIGYSTKGGDSAADIQPIIHLYKKDVYKLADELEIPEEIIKKVPSAGFFEGQTDEDEIGMSYSDLDAALINLEINNYEPSNESEEKVLELIKKSSHKRMPPISVA